MQLKGDSLNTFAIGSKMSVYAQGKQFYRELIPSRGFQSSVDYKQIIGLGDVVAVDSLVIIWPDLTSTTFNRPPVDSVYTINKKTAIQRKVNKPGLTATGSVLFHTVKSTFDKHVEDDYQDFYYERNIPAMLSKEGPKVATGDVNNDQLSDVFIGGTQGHTGQLYLQTAAGTFAKSVQKSFEQFSDFEDEAVLFFDSDNDGDLDLFIGAGGNNNPPGSRQMLHRLFKNDGAGNFIIDINSFENNNDNIGVAVANDFDKDGDLDLFVGGRSVPREYGTNANSYLYVNDGKGHFKDIAKAQNPEIAHIGMVTDAAWVNVLGTVDKELVIVGEWMTPRIFSFNGKGFIEETSNLQNLFGWWQSLSVADVNNDGKQDLIFGNIGENFYLHPNKENPVKLWIADVDGNGDVDKILTRSIEGKDRTVFLKNDIQEQVPSIKKANLKHHDYALKTVQELFPSQILNKAIVKQFNYSSSCVAINNGNGKFTVQKLPYRAQLSSVNAILSIDFNNDGFSDLVTGGNKSGFLPQLEKLDASYGDVFMNDGKGNFTWLSSQQSGIKVTGEVKDIKLMKSKVNQWLIFSRNNEVPVLYKRNFKK